MEGPPRKYTKSGKYSRRREYREKYKEMRNDDDDEGEEIQKFECKYCLYVTIRIKYLALHLQKKHEISIPMPRRPKYEIVGNKIVIVKQEIKEEVKANENNNSDTNNKDPSED